MVFAADRIVEVGEDWRFYFSFSEADRSPNSGIGMAVFHAERVISMQSDQSDVWSYFETLPLNWHGGELLLNANALEGQIQTQVRNSFGQVIQGLSYDDSIPIRENGLRLRVRWKGRDLQELGYAVIQIEFRFRNADLYAYIEKR
jgi:hypothetical protein